jgi:hypothetical protein
MIRAIKLQCRQRGDKRVFMGRSLISYRSGVYNLRSAAHASREDSMRLTLTVTMMLLVGTSAFGQEVNRSPWRGPYFVPVPGQSIHDACVTRLNQSKPVSRIMTQ